MIFKFYVVHLNTKTRIDCAYNSYFKTCMHTRVSAKIILQNMSLESTFVLVFYNDTTMYVAPGATYLKLVRLTIKLAQ